MERREELTEQQLCSVCKMQMAMITCNDCVTHFCPSCFAVKRTFSEVDPNCHNCCWALTDPGGANEDRKHC
jgi:hypothetical protein